MGGTPAHGNARPQPPNASILTLRPTTPKPDKSQGRQLRSGGQRLHARRIVMRRQVHPRRDRHGLEFLGRRRAQELGRGLTRREPGIEAGGRRDERHALVDRLHELGGGGGDDGEGLEAGFSAARLTPNTVATRGTWRPVRPGRRAANRAAGRGSRCAPSLASAPAFGSLTRRRPLPPGSPVSTWRSPPGDAAPVPPAWRAPAARARCRGRRSVRSPSGP
jgi:hypothetical protein